MAELRIYGGIGMPDQWGRAFLHSDLVQFLDSTDDKEITLRINSPGGQVMTGNAIVETLRNSGRTIHAIGEELVGSAATMIFLTGKTRMLYPTTQFFLHNPQGGVMGTADDIEQYLTEIRRDNNNLIAFYIDRTGLDRGTVETLLDSEVFLSGSEAMELGFATALIEPVAAYVQKPKIMKLTEKIKALMTGQPVTNDMELSLADGRKMQVTSQDEVLKPGLMARIANATPEDGDYILADSRTVSIAGGTITNIVVSDPVAPEPVKEEKEEEVMTSPALQQLETLAAKIAELESLVTSQTVTIQANADEMNAAALTMAEHIKTMTSGGVRPPTVNHFSGKQNDGRPLKDKVQDELKRIGINK